MGVGAPVRMKDTLDVPCHWLHVLIWIGLAFAPAYLSDERVYLTDFRETQFRFLFTHNVPFEDMRHLKSRAQRMGIRSDTQFQDRAHLMLYNRTYANMTGVIEDYFKFALSGGDTSSVGQTTLKDIMGKNLIITERSNDFLWNSFIGEIPSDMHPSYRDFFDTFRKQPILDSDLLSSKIPFFMKAMKSWNMVYLMELGSSHDWVEKTGRPWQRREDGVLSKIHDEWSLAFIDEFCRALFRRRDMDLFIPNGFCPNPCITQPCFNIPNTASSKCIPTGTLWNEFNCTCQPRYKWIRPPESRGHCQMNEYCSQYCNPQGTRRCDVIDQKEFCVCRPTHMGPTCNQIRDPCVELSSPTEIPGNVACNVNHGGKCNGTLGTNTYNCVCPPAFISDPSYPLPNCLAFKDRCLSIICIHGDCISSKDGQEVYCSCADEAYGEHCELFRGRWAQWSPWSECTPACGVTQYRRRVRTRDCLGEACRGGEGHLQMEMCSTVPCPDETLALSRQGRHEEIGELKVQMLQAQAARCVKLVGAVGQALIAISCVFAALAATAMAVSVHLMS